MEIKKNVNNPSEVITMKKIILIGIIFLGVLMSGCTKQDGDTVPVSLTKQDTKDVSLELYVPKDMPLGKYEPREGIYLGAYVNKNLDISGEMKNFEDAVEHKQAFTVFQYSSKTPISKQDVLKCIAQKKIPYIKVLLNKDYDMSPLYQMIRELNNNYPTPVFIELFPVTENVRNPLEYKDAYEKSYQLIKRYMEDAVVVWSMDLERLDEWPIYYPGDYLVDWVGLNIYMPVYKDNKKYTPNIMTDIDFWYKSFQTKKPMMLSSVAISHFSRVDHTYTVEEAKNKLALIYEKITSAYPRIKGIIYIDLDMKQVYKEGKDDYRISVQAQLKDYMKTVLKDKKFLNEANPEVEGSIMQYLKYSISGIEIDNRIYIPKECITEFLPQVPLKKLEGVQDISGQTYYSLEELAHYTQFYYTNKGQ